MNWQEWSALAEDTTFWEHHVEKGLLKVEHVRDYVLRLWFEDERDVAIYELDFYPLLVLDNPGGVFVVLQNRERFRQARGDYALIWANPETGAYDEHALDLAPECVRFFCEKYGKVIKSAHPVTAAMSA